MTQPDLGFRLAELRKSKGLTQQELSEISHVNIRTIQRIELGKVEPRTYSMKLLLKAMEVPYDEFFATEGNLRHPRLQAVVKTLSFFRKHQSEHETSQILLWAAIAGAIYFVAGFPEGVLGSKAIKSFLTGGEETVFILSKIVAFISFVFFMKGFAIIGKRNGDQLLFLVSMVLAVLYPIFSVMEIAVMISGHNILGIVIWEGICLGVLDIIFGYCLFRSEKLFGRLGVVAGLLEILAGFTFVTVVLGFIGLFVIIPAELLEILLLFRFYFRMSNVKAENYLSGA